MQSFRKLPLILLLGRQYEEGTTLFQEIEGISPSPYGHTIPSQSSGPASSFKSNCFILFSRFQRTRQ